MVVLNSQQESSTRATLEIEVPASEVEKALEEVTRAFAKRAAIPGFRKGHAPDSLVQQRFSEQIREEVLESLLPGALASAVEERNLSVLGKPRIEGLRWEPPGPIRFSARLDLKPQIDPGDYREIPVEDVLVEPLEEEVVRALDRLREAHAEFHPIEGRRAAVGDYAVVDITGSFVEILVVPGQNPRTFRDEKQMLEIGHPESMPEINEALLGAGVGEARRFRKSFPEDFENEDFRGKAVDYQVTVVALKEKRLPALDDDFARLVSDSQTLEDLRQRIREGLRREKQLERRRKLRRAILDALLSRTQIPAPEVLVEAEVASALRDYARYLVASRVNPEVADWRRLREEARSGAERRVKEYLLLDAIAQREGVSVSDAELEAEFRQEAARRRTDPAILREQMAKADGIEALRDEIRLGKAVDLLISSARVLPSVGTAEAK